MTPLAAAANASPTGYLSSLDIQTYISFGAMLVAVFSLIGAIFASDRRVRNEALAAARQVKDDVATAAKLTNEDMGRRFDGVRGAIEEGHVSRERLAVEVRAYHETDLSQHAEILQKVEDVRTDLAEVIGMLKARAR
jgi:hypothetical protein